MLLGKTVTKEISHKRVLRGLWGCAFAACVIREKCPNPLTIPCARHWMRVVPWEKLWPWVKKTRLSWAKVKCCHMGTQLSALNHQLPTARVTSASVLRWDLDGPQGIHYTLFASCSHAALTLPHLSTNCWWEWQASPRAHHANTCSRRESAASDENPLRCAGAAVESEFAGK